MWVVSDFSLLSVPHVHHVCSLHLSDIMCIVFTSYQCIVHVSCVSCVYVLFVYHVYCVSTYHIHYHVQIAGLYLLLVYVSDLKKKRKSRKWLYVIYASYKCEEAAYYRLFLLEKLKRHFKKTAYIYLKGFTSSKRLSNESFNVII